MVTAVSASGNPGPSNMKGKQGPNWLGPQEVTKAKLPSLESEDHFTNHGHEGGANHKTTTTVRGHSSPPS